MIRHSDLWADSGLDARLDCCLQNLGLGMITVQQAVNSAISYVQEFGHILPSGGMRLEETDYDEDASEWLITLSFSENLVTEHRSFKLFRIDAVDGAIKSMTARKMAA